MIDNLVFLIDCIPTHYVCVFIIVLGFLRAVLCHAGSDAIDVVHAVSFKGMDSIG